MQSGQTVRQLHRGGANLNGRETMRGRTQRIAWSLFAAGAAAAGAVIAHSVLEKAWKQIRQKDPPLNPAAPKVTWSEALTWGAAAGIVAGVSRVVARRGAVAAWARMFGHLPPDRNK
jgi:hypothetical protein